MKRFLGHIMFFIYLFSLSGLMVQLHFCESQLAHWSLVTTSKQSTSPNCCEEPSPLLVESSLMAEVDCNMNECCEDHFVHIDSEKDYVNASNNSIDLSYWFTAVLPIWVDHNKVYIYDLEESINIRNTGPPVDLLASIPIYLKIQKLIFYA